MTDRQPAVGLTRAQVHKISLSGSELAQCEAHAQAAEIGGRSNVRDKDRAETLTEDQRVGQVATYAGLKQMFGICLGWWLYTLGRWEADKHPMEGDGGEDVPGGSLDFKGSLMRASDDPLKYVLPVRPRERHPGWTYVLVLVEREWRHAYVVGWCADDELSPVIAEGTFTGAHVVKSRQLHPMMPIRYFAR